MESVVLLVGDRLDVEELKQQRDGESDIQRLLKPSRRRLLFGVLAWFVHISWFRRCQYLRIAALIAVQRNGIVVVGSMSCAVCVEKGSLRCGCASKSHPQRRLDLSVVDLPVRFCRRGQ